MFFVVALLGCRETLVPSVAAPERDAQRAWGRLLKEVVTADGYVDYDALEQNREPLDGYVAWLATERAWSGRLTKDWHHQYLNAYNALVIYQILARGRPESVLDVPSIVPKPGFGFFVSTDFQLDLDRLSLYEIEHERIRAKELDYRDHAAMNCGSRSCPPLRNELYRKDTIESQLADQMDRWVADDGRGVRVNEDGTLTISPIFDWYVRDFEFDSAGMNLCEVLLQHAHGDKRRGLRKALDRGCAYDVSEYDWSLNDAR